eukprot:194371_1
MSSIECSTDSLLPSWVSIGFILCSLLILLIIAFYSMKRLKNDGKYQSNGCFAKIKMIAMDVWKKKSIYLPIVAHISDTATDFGTVIEFGIVAFTAICTEINMYYLFGLSIASMFLYRILSSCIIFAITRSFK